MSRSFVRALTTIVVSLSLFACASLVGCSGSSGASPASSSSSSASAAQVSVTTSIDASSAEEPVSEVTVSLPAGSTVLDALKSSASSVDCQDSQYGQFVTSINGLSNGDKGAQSGWCYTVNDASPAVSAGELEVNDGDSIVWTYVM